MHEQAKVTQEQKDKLNSKAVVARKEEPRNVAMVKSFASQLSATAPSHIKGDVIVTAIVNLMRKTPELLECSQQSLLGAAFTATTLGLNPTPGLSECYLVPFRDKSGQQQCEFIIGKNGYKALVSRAGIVKYMTVQTVREKDELVFSLTEEKPNMVFKPKLFAEHDADNPIRGFFAVVYYKDGGCSAPVLMSKDEVDRIRKTYSKGQHSDKSPWNREYESMAHKTVLKKLLRNEVLSPDLLKYDTRDTAVIRADQLALPAATTPEQIDASFEVIPTTEIEEGLENRE